MSDHTHPHNSPANPYHESHRSERDDKALEERVAKIESLLVEKGIVSREALDKLVDIYEHDLGPMNGARVVARAWLDPDYKQRLLENATAAIAELGYGGMQGEHMVVVENTPTVHNVVVCTLCSCYPWPVLGLPPTWYKSSAYRSRIVIDPRSVLKLAIGAAALVIPMVFDLSYTPRFASLATIWISVVGLTVVVGLLGSRELLKRPPLPVLREAPE